MYEYRNSKTASILVFIILISVDQFSKYIIRLRHLVDDGFYICNKNIAFGIPIPDFLFWLFWLLIVALLLIMLYEKYPIAASPVRKYDTLFIIIILAGAISNIIDRLFFGCVIDFIDLKFWPVFNLADIFITIGAIMLIYSLAFKKPLTR